MGGGDDRFSLRKVRCISMLVTATHRLHSSSFLWFILRILSGSPKKELLRSLWVVIALTNPSVWILGTKGWWLTVACFLGGRSFSKKTSSLWPS